MTTDPDRQGAEIRIEPLGVTIESRPGEPLMQAARRQGLKWPTICNGSGICGVCHVRVLETAAPLPPIGPKEERALRNVMPPFDGPDTRLACQLVLRGFCVVERSGVVGG